ncbi:MAG TPA: PP2C family serine/threonine-protein phosphatase [bacterium]|nr:PP2C family serine/threonine-protein phosphatase [bacterium]
MLLKISLSNIKFGNLMPSEDSLAVKKNVFVLADGITRDPKLPPRFKSNSIKDILKYYPRPSGAKVVADICTTSFIEFAKNDLDIKHILCKVNSRIAEYNKKKIKKVNFLENDYFGCVAAGGFIINNILHYGYLGDCGIAIINSKGNLRFQTKDGMQDFIAFENKYLKTKEFNWSLKTYRQLIRSKYRNKNKLNNGKLISYGAFTGEKAAEKFIVTGQKRIQAGEYIIFYSDGFHKILHSKEFLKIITDKNIGNIKKKIIVLSARFGKEDYEKYGRERSLIIKKV